MDSDEAHEMPLRYEKAGAIEASAGIRTSTAATATANANATAPSCSQSDCADAPAADPTRH